MLWLSLTSYWLHINLLWIIFPKIQQSFKTFVFVCNVMKVANSICSCLLIKKTTKGKIIQISQSILRPLYPPALPFSVTEESSIHFSVFPLMTLGLFFASYKNQMSLHTLFYNLFFSLKPYHSDKLIEIYLILILFHCMNT